MKRYVGILLLLALCLGLCACGDSNSENEEQPTSTAVDLASGAWQGEGGCYRTEAVTLPKGAGIQFCRDGAVYSMGYPDMEKTVAYRDGEELFSYSGMAYGLCRGEDGIWLMDEERDPNGDTVVLQRYSFDGEPGKSLRMQLPPDCFALSLRAAEGLLYLQCSDSLRILDSEGALQAQIPHEQWAGRLLQGGDGMVYYYEELGKGGVLSAVDAGQGTLQELFAWERGAISCGDGESPFLLVLPEGVYRMDLSGETRPLVIWDECLLSISGVSELYDLGEGRFLLSGNFTEPMLLVPAKPEDLKPRTMLTLAVLPTQDVLDFESDPTVPYTNVAKSIGAFNARSQDCYVKLLDLSEGGALTAEQALTKLNTRILSGQAPDMLVLSGSLSPFPFLRQGLLRDLGQDLTADGELRAEDLVLARAIENDCGGLYVMADSFTIEARLGLQSRFGDVWGWSFDDYYRIDGEMAPGKMTIYNLTAEYFLENSVSRYLRTAIDWQNGSCDFENPDFVRLLEACRNVRATPEDPENMIFGVNLMGDGVLATEFVWLDDATDLAKECRGVGQSVSVIGWPTPDGSCGTDFGISYPIGVMKDGKHPELCWSFLKYCLLHAENNIPNYRPLLEAQIEEARHIDPNTDWDMWYDGLRSPITEEEEKLLRELLARVEHTTLRDETAFGIVKEEIAPYLAGERSAEETARVIQQRMRIYVAEQG